MLKDSWYRPALALCLLGPALVCQSVGPSPVSAHAWEDLSEGVYTTLLRWQTPDGAGLAPSKVVVLEVDAKTIDAYGWPLDSSHYVQALAKLKAAGRPWVVSFLWQQERAKSAADANEKALHAAQDQALADAIKDYDRFIGTGLVRSQEPELDEDQGRLLTQVTLSRSGKPVDVTDLQLALNEDDRFVAAERAVGFGTLFGTEPVVNCMTMYLTDLNGNLDFVIPSSLVWTAAYAGGAQIHTGEGASWPRPGESLPYAFKNRLDVAYKECLTSPAVLTRDFLEKRDIKTVSLVDFLESPAPASLAGKIVMLGYQDLKQYRGPGAAEVEADAIVPEHKLAARFLDGLVTGHIIHRSPMTSVRWLGWLPWAAAGALLLGSLVLPLEGAMALAAIMLLALVGAAAVSLEHGAYVVPIQTMTSVAATLAGLAALWAYLRYYGVRRVMRFSTSLRESLSQCNTLAEVETLSRQLCQAEFANATLAFADFDRELYEAANDANAALALLDRRRLQPEVLAEGGRFETVMTRVNRPAGVVRLPARNRGLKVQLALASKLGRLGTARIELAYKPHEEGFVPALLDVLRVEVSQHWHRIKLLVDQKLLDYKYLREQTRGEIMARFLTKVLVAKFSDGRTMEENLKVVLVPRPTRAALMQADIRGYSQISAKLRPEEMVRLLQSYYRNVVDAAQMVAQVKLIGDCIFLFIEEDAGTPLSSPADLALELAGLLVKETEAQNAARRNESLHFGIAIHYGEVVVGNLSSDSCIDYTVIGTNVNLVARLEELTKNPRVAERVGANGVIVSREAANALVRHRQLELLDLDLGGMGVSVRSFPQIVDIAALPADRALSLAKDGSPQRKAS